MKRSRALLLCSSLPFFGYPARAGARETAVSPEQRASLTELVAEASDAPQTVGFSVGVARHGSTIYQTARGRRALSPDAAATVSTWYGIGSVTKQFTAALVMQLVEARRLRLDDRLVSVAPSFPHAAAITFRQLLNHTSGLAEYSSEAVREGLIGKANVQPSQLVALIAEKPLGFAPGTQWEYCNSNYLALGLTIEALRSKPYAEVLHERIFAPLALELSVAPPSGVELARGYTESEPPKAMSSPDISWAYAAGEIYGTVHGLLAWNHALFNGRVVSANSLALMTTPTKLPDGKTTGYGFGLSVQTVRGHRIVSHNGGVPGGFAAQNFVFPEDHLSVATLANTIDFNAALPATKLADVFLPGISAALEETMRQQIAEYDDPVVRERARKSLEWIRTGTIDEHEVIPELKAAWTPAAIKPAQELLTSAGTVQRLRLAGFVRRGTLRIFVYDVKAASSHFTLTFVLDAQDRVAGLFVKP